MRRFLSCFHSAAQTGFDCEVIVLPELIAVEIAVPHLHHLLIAGIAPAPALIDRALADIDDLCFRIGLTELIDAARTDIGMLQPDTLHHRCIQERGDIGL